MCGSLKSFLEYEVKKDEQLSKYHVDIEYNRNAGKVKTIIDENYEIINITCDLIVHSRGEIEKQDNILAIEMKKSNRPDSGKLADKKRLRALTKKTNNGETWPYGGKVYPKHVCGYLLGVYYEIDILNEKITIEYYIDGSLNEVIEKKFKSVFKKRRLPK